MPPRPPTAPSCDELVDHATVLLEAHGPDAVTLRSVAEAAGVSTQVLYSRFGSKAALLAAMVAAGLARLDRALDDAATGDRPAELPDLARAYQRFAHDHPHLYDLMLGQVVDKRAHPDLAAAAERLVARFLAAVAPHRPDPVDARRVVDLAWASTHGIVTLERAGLLSDPDGQLVARSATALLREPPRHDPLADELPTGEPRADEPQTPGLATRPDR